MKNHGNFKNAIRSSRFKKEEDLTLFSSHTEVINYQLLERLRFNLQLVLKHWLMGKQGIIENVYGTSNWISPLVIVPKDDGDI